LEYGLSASAVARSWGDKVIEWWTDSLNLHLWGPLDPGNQINIFAAVIQLVCVVLLLRGAEVGKVTVNFFTVLKIVLVLFMIFVGFANYTPKNMTPFLPKGMSGAMRGATSAFFGYLGYDEVCCMAGEAKDPKKTLATAVVGSIIGVTVLSVLAAWALVGMQDWKDIDPDDGFVDAFKSIGAGWAQQITAIGELVCLPLVVLVSFLAQPRLLYAMAEDRLIPKFFSKVNKKGTLFNATLTSGLFCTVIALFVPFTFLNDMIRCFTLFQYDKQCFNNYSTK
jgi:APA family basic amino acid/polyamine antiporter